MEVEQDMAGACKAIMFQQDKVLIVSPAMYEALEHDREETLKTLQVVVAEKFVEQSLGKLAL